jgi:hypothetical protein
MLPRKHNIYLTMYINIISYDFWSQFWHKSRSQAQRLHCCYVKLIRKACKFSLPIIKWVLLQSRWESRSWQPESRSQFRHKRNRSDHAKDHTATAILYHGDTIQSQKAYKFSLPINKWVWLQSRWRVVIVSHFQSTLSLARLTFHGNSGHLP